MTGITHFAVMNKANGQLHGFDCESKLVLGAELPIPKNLFMVLNTVKLIIVTMRFRVLWNSNIIRYPNWLFLRLYYGTVY